MTVNYTEQVCGTAGLVLSVQSLKLQAVRGQEDLVKRIANKVITQDEYRILHEAARHIGVTKRFEDVIKTFKTPERETPAGFRTECFLDAEGVLRFDLIRDIGYDRNGEKRPTRFVFSADSANPYEVAPIAPLLGNLTCNPGIVYDLFINNPKANIGNKFKTRDEVMVELGRILGPGCDISVELNNPFEEDFNKILEECEKFKEILSEYRLVVKVPHTGPVNSGNVHELLEGDKKFDLRYDQGTTADALRGHNLALKLREHGYRINYTLMFEPYQTALALQAKPYFINSFIRHRYMQTEAMSKHLNFFNMTGNKKHLEDLRAFMLGVDLLNRNESGRELLDVKKYAEDTINYRKLQGEGSDGLDGVRHNLRLFRTVS